MRPGRDTIERIIVRPERYQLPGFILVAGPLLMFFGVPFLSDRPLLGALAIAFAAVVAWYAHPGFARESFIRVSHDPTTDTVTLDLDRRTLSFVRSQVKYLITVYNSDSPDDLYVVYHDKSSMQIPDEPYEAKGLLVEAAGRWGIRHISKDYFDPDQ